MQFCKQARSNIANIARGCEDEMRPRTQRLRCVCIAPVERRDGKPSRVTRSLRVTIKTRVCCVARLAPILDMGCTALLASIAFWSVTRST
jgi:hypothetical protein